MFDRVQQEFGTLDIFVSNARPELAAFYQPPMALTLEQWHTGRPVTWGIQAPLAVEVSN